MSKIGKPDDDDRSTQDDPPYSVYCAILVGSDTRGRLDLCRLSERSPLDLTGNARSGRETGDCGSIP